MKKRTLQVPFFLHFRGVRLSTLRCFSISGLENHMGFWISDITFSRIQKTLNWNLATSYMNDFGI